MAKDIFTYQELEDQIVELKKQNEILKLHSSIKNDEEYYCNHILNNISDPIFMKDDQSRLLIVNNAFCETFGLSRVDIIGKTLAEDVPPKERENFLKIDKEVIENGLENISEESLTVRGNETRTISTRKTRFIDSNDKKVLIGIIRDITDRKKSEEALRISEAQFRGLFVQSHIGSALVRLDRSLMRCNEAFCQFTGYTEKELIGKTIADFTHPDDLEIGINDIKQIIKGEIQSALVQKRYIRKDGAIVWGELSISLVRDENNEPIYFLPVIQDITESHKAKTLLKESEKQLKELNSTKDQLFSIIAHDLRGPFNNILGFSEVLIENIHQYELEKSKKYLGYINSSSKNTLILLDNLLNWAKSQTGQISFNPKKTLFSDVILEIIELKKPRANTKNISLNYLSSNEIEVRADKEMLKTVLRNLISNAIKFTEFGGHIQISAVSKQNHVEITVSDDGIGINKEKLKGLFKIYSDKTDIGTANEKGSGLGLVLCKEFVKIHKGEIWVNSEEGKGSDFKFTLPLNNSKF